MCETFTLKKVTAPYGGNERRTKLVTKKKEKEIGDGGSYCNLKPNKQQAAIARSRRTFLHFTFLNYQTRIVIHYYDVIFKGGEVNLIVFVRS